MYLRCQSCGGKFSLGEFVTLPDRCHACQLVGREVAAETRTRLDTWGERNVGWLMLVTGLALCFVAAVFDTYPSAAIASKWKVGIGGLVILSAGLARIRFHSRRLRKLERDTL